MTFFLTSFSVESEDGPWKEVLHVKWLKDSRQQKDPLPLQEFSFPVHAGRYVKYEGTAHYGAGGGLQFFNIIHSSSCEVPEPEPEELLVKLMPEPEIIDEPLKLMPMREPQLMTVDAIDEPNIMNIAPKPKLIEKRRYVYGGPADKGK